MNGNYPAEIVVIPEDDRIDQVLIGFQLGIDFQRMRRQRPAGGWKEAIAKISVIPPKPNRFIVVVIDEDKNVDHLAMLPAQHSHAGIYAITIRQKVEHLRREMLQSGLIKKNSFQEIGELLAADCRDNSSVAWDCQSLAHNSDRLTHMKNDLRAILFE
jgi:hypothetical protein